MFTALFTPVKGPWVWVAPILVALAFVLILAGLNLLPGRQKKQLAVLITFLAGLFYLLEFLIPAGLGANPGASGGTDNLLTPALSPFADAVQIIGALALGLGILNLVRVNGRVLIRLQPGWLNSAIFFVGFLGMIATGLYNNAHPDNKLWGVWYQFFFKGLYQSLSGTVFALLAFFIASAAFRAFRLSSVEASLMMITAFIVMLGNVGSEVLTGWIPLTSPFAFLRLDNMTLWIMTTVNMSAQRALLFGIAMGELAIALRIWLSLERGHFFDQEV